jgi:hypothetical protein
MNNISILQAEESLFTSNRVRKMGSAFYRQSTFHLSSDASLQAKFSKKHTLMFFSSM